MKTSKTEAIVLKSMRYSESDRILQIFTKHSGMVSGIAKGVRKVGSRFGGRLEVFFRSELMLYQGKGDLFTVTQANTVESYSSLRTNRHALDCAGTAAEAAYKLIPQGEANVAAYNLFCRFLQLIDSLAKSGGDQAWQEVGLAFRLKLLLTTGFAPAMDCCAVCGNKQSLTQFSGSDGGMVCDGCSANSFAFSHSAQRFLANAVEHPLAQTPTSGGAVLRQVDRAINETLFNHAHVKLGSVLDRI